MAGAIAAMAENDCKSAVVAEGKPAALRDLGAYPNSLLAWRSAVKEKYGSEFNSWRYSKDAKVDCVQKDDKQWVCKRTARPCKDVLHKVLDGAAAKIKANCKDEPLSSYGAANRTKRAPRGIDRRLDDRHEQKVRQGVGPSGIKPPAPTSTATR